MRTITRIDDICHRIVRNKSCKLALSMLCPHLGIDKYLIL